MSRILFCWELGKSDGHLAPLLVLARALREAGHDVGFAVRDTHTAERLLGPDKFPWQQAPITLEPQNLFPQPQHFGQLLMNVGFHDAGAITGRARAWRALFADFKPDILAFDHAPTALLASRGLPARRIVTGSGFLMPPETPAWPALHPAQPADAARLADADSQLLDNLNRALAALDAPALAHTSELYATDARALFTWPELDHFPGRPDADYWGPLPSPAANPPPQWPASDGKRIFAYLRPFKTLPALLQALRDSGAATLAYLPARSSDIAKFEGDNLRFTNRPVDLARAAAECDLGIVHGGHGTVCSLLLTGKPLLVLPVQLEMQLMAANIERLGAGLSAPRLAPDGMASKLKRLLDEPAFGAAARAIAERYAAFDPQAPVRRFVTLVERLG